MEKCKEDGEGVFGATLEFIPLSSWMHAAAPRGLKSIDIRDVVLIK